MKIGATLTCFPCVLQNASLCFFFYYGRLVHTMPPVVLLGHNLECASEMRYLGVTLQPNVATWNRHCELALKCARAVMFAFRNYYAQFTKEIVLHVFKSVASPILEYCAEVVLPSAYYDERFEQVQKMALALHFRNFSMSSECYQQRLITVNLSNLRSRRCATCLVSFLKMHLGLMHVQPGYFCLKDDWTLDARTSI